MRLEVLEYDDLLDCFYLMRRLFFSGLLEGLKQELLLFQHGFSACHHFPTKQYYAVQLGKVHIDLFPASELGEEHQNN